MGKTSTERSREFRKSHREAASFHLDKRERTQENQRASPETEGGKAEEP